MWKIRITFESLSVTAELNASSRAQALVAALPISSEAKVWGDEIYFDTPVAQGEEDAQAKVPSGTVAYWPVGKALCLLFGQTPYSPVNVAGTLNGDPAVLAGVKEGEGGWSAASR